MKKKQRKVLNLLEDLPEPYRTQAIQNCKEHKGSMYTGDIKRVSVYEALLCAFIWHLSPEEHTYWYDLAEIYFIKEDLPNVKH